MRILLVTEDVPVVSPGGAGKHAILLGNALIEEGHDVELLGRLRTSDVAGNNDFVGTLHCRIDLNGTGWKEHGMGVFLPGKRANIARRIWAGVRALGADSYDVIHYHGHHSVVGATAPAGLKFIQTLHDQGSECIALTRFRDGAPCDAIDPRICAACATPRPNALQTAVSALAVRRLRRASTIAFSRHPTIFVSKFLERRFREIVQPPLAPRTHVIHNFTNTVRMSKLAEQLPVSSAGQRPVALMVGRVDANKGMLALLEQLPDSLVARYQWRVLGDGPQRRSAEEAHGPRGVEFRGFLPQDQIYAETLNAAVCVVPSVWEEPCGTTVLEALALGKPVFALDRGGTPELARYARHAGQLNLAPSIEGLVAALAAHQPGIFPKLVGVSDAADVRERLPAILDVYRGAIASAGTAAARAQSASRAE